MEASLRPHRGGTVLTLGILGVIPILGFIPALCAWVIGAKDLRGMCVDRVDPSGRTITQAGRVLGIVGTVGWTLFLCGAVLLYGGHAVGQSTGVFSDSDHPGVHQVTHYYESEREPASGDMLKELVYQERQRTNGSWVKDGPFVHWTRDHEKLEEGSYTDGKRTGTWTFWNDDGSVDHARSGVYANDVKVRD
jgi:hypothetical protein